MWQFSGQHLSFRLYSISHTESVCRKSRVEFVETLSQAENYFNWIIILFYKISEVEATYRLYGAKGKAQQNTQKKHRFENIGLNKIKYFSKTSKITFFMYVHKRVLRLYTLSKNTFQELVFSFHHVISEKWIHVRRPGSKSHLTSPELKS